MLVVVVSGMCDCEAENKPTHIADIIKAADNILKVEVVVTDPPPTLRKGRSGPGLRMEYKAKVLHVIKGLVRPATVDIKQLVFSECPPPTLQGVYFISGAMGGKKGTGKHENLFYLDPCGIALPGDSSLRTALDTLGNDETNLCLNGEAVKDCDDVCTSTSCAEEGAKCIVSKCATSCMATWASNGTVPKVMCPSGLPSGVIADAIANLEERAKLLIQAREAFRLDRKEEGYKLLAIVAKLSAGGEEYRVPPTTTTTEPPTTEAPEDTQKPLGLQGLLELAKNIPAVGDTLDKFREMAASVSGQKFVPKFKRRRKAPLSREARRAAKKAARRALRMQSEEETQQKKRKKRRKGGKGGKGKRSAGKRSGGKPKSNAGSRKSAISRPPRASSKSSGSGKKASSSSSKGRK